MGGVGGVDEGGRVGGVDGVGEWAAITHSRVY